MEPEIDHWTEKYEQKEQESEYSHGTEYKQPGVASLNLAIAGEIIDGREFIANGMCADTKKRMVLDFVPSVSPRSLAAIESGLMRGTVLDFGLNAFCDISCELQGNETDDDEGKY